MKRILLLIPMLCVLMLFHSCIQDEAPNAECDIVGLDQAWLKENKSKLIGMPRIKNNTVDFTVKDGTEMVFAPVFVLTDGAVLTYEKDGVQVPANGVERDFTTPQIYVVHSEDGAWEKTYTVTFSSRQYIQQCSFEHFKLDEATKRYQEWYEIAENDDKNPVRDYWATGNSGYALTGMGKDVNLYPTVSSPEGVSGSCVKLETRSTGSFGSMAGMPIAAGNIFIGTFDTKIAMLQPRVATGFGRQLLAGKPVSLSGYYKYTPGEKFQDKNKVIHPELRDKADIYAVVYEVDPEDFKPLDGDEVLSSERIVLMARIDEPGEPKDWLHFEEPFRPMNGKVFDETRFLNDGYAIAVVATSSREGAFFEGAIGSVLYVDELRISYEGDRATQTTSFFD